MKIHPVWAELLLHADRKTDGGMDKWAWQSFHVVFRNFENATEEVLLFYE